MSIMMIDLNNNIIYSSTAIKVSLYKKSIQSCFLISCSKRCISCQTDSPRPSSFLYCSVWILHYLCSFHFLFIFPRHLLLSKTPLPPTLSTDFSVISLLVRDSPSECLPFSPNHFKTAVLQCFSFYLPYSNTECCMLSSIWSHLPSSFTFLTSLLQHLFIHQSFSQSFLTSCFPHLLFTLIAIQGATYPFPLSHSSYLLINNVFIVLFLCITHSVLHYF